MDERYLNEVEAVGLFGKGICEICGKKGAHPVCYAKALECDRKFQECDARLLKQYTIYGGYGALGPDSQSSLDQAVDALQRYLRRPIECELAKAIEGASWWFLPEGWIGMMGFIIEKGDFSIFPLGSGLCARSKLQFTPAYWCGIIEYMCGRVESVVRSEP